MRAIASLLKGCLTLVVTAAVAGALYLFVSGSDLSWLGTTGPFSDLLELAGLGDVVQDTADQHESTDPPKVPESEHGLWYEQLSEDQRYAYDWLLAHLAAREDVFVIDGVSESETGPAYRAIIGDHPEFFWLTGGYTYRQPEDGSFIEVTPGLTVSADEVVALKEQIETAAEDLIAQIPADASDYEKARFCYAWVIDNTGYEEAAHDQNIQGVFLDRKAVCAGYARAFQYLMHRMGIRCEYLSGGGHAWNLAWIGDTPTYIDTTWGDPVFVAESGERAPDSMTYDYLCLTADELYRNHTVAGPVSDPSLLPACDDASYDYYRLNGCYFDEFASWELADLINEAAWRGERSVRVKYGSEEAYQQALEYLKQDVFAVDALAGINTILRGGDEVLHIVSVEW